MSRSDNMGRSRPGDFPVGSLESRAATRAMLQTRYGIQSKPIIFRASWVGRPEGHENCVIYDYQTGLPISATYDPGVTTEEGET